jgi:glycosyltransferase involved in cell wall biosynthesis
MRVGVISPEFPPEIGGIQTYAFEFVRELARRRLAVTVFTRPHTEGEISIPGVTVVPGLKSRRALDRQILQQPGMDVWHVMNAAYAWVALEGVPTIISVHGNDFLQPYIPVEQPNLQRLPGVWRFGRWPSAAEKGLGRWFTRRMVRRALPKAKHIITNSRYTEQMLLEQYPACRGITSAAMVGVSADYLLTEPSRTAIGHSRLITVCRLAEQRKNVNLILQALATIKERYEFSYTVVGDGPLRADLERLTHQLRLWDRVRFAGFVETATLRRWLSESDLFVLTSSVRPASHEGFGIAYLEANACGTPVLAARLAGAVEAVAEGVSGFFVDEPSAGSIAQALERFFRQEIRFDPKACRAFASQFTWEKVVDHALDFYPSPA